MSSLQYQSSPAFLRSANPINFVGSTCWEGELQEEGENAQLNLSDYREMLTTYLELSILDPAELWQSVFPPIVAFTEPTKGKPAQGYRGRIDQSAGNKTPAGSDEVDDAEGEKAEREIGLRVAGLVGLSWVLREFPKASESNTAASTGEEQAPATDITDETAPATASGLPSDLTNLLSSPMLWSSLSSSTSPSSSSAALGALQPAIRKVGWDVLRACLLRWPAVIGDNLETIALTALRACWIEEDQGTVVAMMEPLLLLLTSGSPAVILASCDSLLTGLVNHFKL